MAQSMLGGYESASQGQTPMMGVHPVNKKPVGLCLSVPCESGNCEKCPGKTARGFWTFKDIGMKALLKTLFPNGVRCPCGCHD